ncbi:MAG: L,D-transpeptidase family protein [Candidatus Falkowbacteria bacterium]
MRHKSLILLLLIGSLLFLASPSRAVTPVDSDNDGLGDNLELQFHTDPHNPDTDGDGFKDGEEVDWGYNPLAKSTSKLAQKIEINLKSQRLAYFVGGVKLKEFVVSTGKKSTPTPKGDFKIKDKIKKAWSRSHGLWMPYWLGIGGGVGIHELPIWPNGYREGENHLGTPVSHGCIRLGLKDAAYVFDRVAPGVSVKIY